MCSRSSSVRTSDAARLSSVIGRRFGGRGRARRSEGRAVNRADGANVDGPDGGGVAGDGCVRRDLQGGEDDRRGREEARITHSARYGLRGGTGRGGRPVRARVDGRRGGCGRREGGGNMTVSEGGDVERRRPGSTDGRRRDGFVVVGPEEGVARRVSRTEYLSTGSTVMLPVDESKGDPTVGLGTGRGVSIRLDDRRRKEGNRTVSRRPNGGCSVANSPPTEKAASHCLAPVPLRCGQAPCREIGGTMARRRRGS